MSDHDEDDGPCTAGGIKYEVVRKHQESIRREQRRYETARDVFAGFAANPYRDCAPEDFGDVAYLSRSAFEWADAFIAELDKPVAAKQETVTFQVGQLVRVKGQLHPTFYEVKSVYDTHVNVMEVNGYMHTFLPDQLESAEPSPK